MAWSIYTHATLGDVRRPNSLATCDRCGFIYNRNHLKWQYDWAGLKEMNRGVLVCQKCMDTPQAQLKTIQIPIDPVSIMNPRPGEFADMVIESSPDVFATVAPSQIVVESTTSGATIGDRTPIVTQNTSKPLLTETTVTPYPDPNAGAGGYTRQGVSS